MSILDEAHDFQIGRVVRHAFMVWRRNAIIFLALAALLFAPSLIVFLYNAQTSALTLQLAGAAPTLDPDAIGTIVALMGSLLETLCIGLIQAALTQGLVADRKGERPAFGKCLGTSLRCFGPVIALAFFRYLIVVVGLALLIAPGLMASAAFMLIIPVRVSERTSIPESFRRSRVLTRGYRWPILGWVLIYTSANVATEHIARLVAGAGQLARDSSLYASPAYLIGHWLFQVVLASISSVVAASLYYELREAKEGAGTEELAAAFD